MIDDCHRLELLQRNKNRMISCCWKDTVWMMDVVLHDDTDTASWETGGIIPFHDISLDTMVLPRRVSYHRVTDVELGDAHDYNDDVNLVDLDISPDTMGWIAMRMFEHHYCRDVDVVDDVVDMMNYNVAWTMMMHDEMADPEAPWEGHDTSTPPICPSPPWGFVVANRTLSHRHHHPAGDMESLCYYYYYNCLLHCHFHDPQKIKYSPHFSWILKS